MCVLAAAYGARAAADVELQRVRGDVAFAYGATASPAPLAGSILLDREAYALTGAAALAKLVLPDSSQVQIGDRTRVRIGAVVDAAGDSRTFTLERGALRFAVEHPAGPQTTYRFVTPTSQTAIRGTVGYVVHGPGGDQIYCVSCAPGDVTITAGIGQYTLTSGQTLDVSARDGFVTGATIVPNASVNNPAIDQFLAGFSPFGAKAANGDDPTESGSGR